MPPKIRRRAVTNKEIKDSPPERFCYLTLTRLDLVFNHSNEWMSIEIL